MYNNVCMEFRFSRNSTMFPKIAVYFGRENGEIFYDSITLWAIKTPYDKVLRKETIAYRGERFPLSIDNFTSSLSYKTNVWGKHLLDKHPQALSQRRDDQNTFSLNFTASPNYYPKG